MPWSQDRAAKALEFAAEAHGDQRVPGKSYSYVVHLAVQCALLHDVLEDTDTPETALLANFGPSVTRGVRALTKNNALPPAERMSDSLRRILEQPVEVGMVKLADRLCNLTEPSGRWTAGKIAA